MTVLPRSWGIRGESPISMLQRTCTHCGTLNHIPPERAERVNRCLECGEKLPAAVVLAEIVPQPMQPPPAPIAASPPAAAPPPPPADPVAEATSAGGLLSSFFIHDLLSFEVSAIVHAAAILILGMIIEPPRFQQPLNLVSSPAYAEEVIEELSESPLDSLEIIASETAFTPVAQLIPFDPSESARNEGLEQGPENLAPLGGLDLASDFALPTSPLALLLGSGGSGRGGGLIHGRGDLAVFSRRLTKAGARTGDIQVSLIWQNFNDLDLHVQAPSGEVVYFQHRRSRCRGVLDVDMNAGGRENNEPVENIYWPAGRAPTGEYIVSVNHYANHGDTDPSSFEVLVQVDGALKTFRKTISHGEPPLEIYRFERTKGRPRIDSPNDDFPL